MLRSVFEVARAVPESPVIAVGGIRSGTDAIEAMLAGAWAVQVGTATLVEPSAPVAVAQGIVRYLKDKRPGLAGRRPGPAPGAHRRSAAVEDDEEVDA